LLYDIDVEDPKHKTKSDLIKSQNRQRSNENLKFKGKERTLRDFDSKIEQKENCYFRMNYKKGDRYTRTKMLISRRDQEIAYNSKNFKINRSLIYQFDPYSPKDQKAAEESKRPLPSFYKVVKHHPDKLGKDNMFFRIVNSQVLSEEVSAEDMPDDPFKKFEVSCKK
jgi:hypothetical protein